MLRRDKLMEILKALPFTEAMELLRADILIFWNTLYPKLDFDEILETYCKENLMIIEMMGGRLELGDRKRYTIYAFMN